MELTYLLINLSILIVMDVMVYILKDNSEDAVKKAKINIVIDTSCIITTDIIAYYFIDIFKMQEVLTLLNAITCMLVISSARRELDMNEKL